MNSMDLDGRWLIHWTDGQRGATSYIVRRPGTAGEGEDGGAPLDIADDFDSAKWIDAEVPGEVHLDLMRAGILEDPYQGLGVVRARWVEEYMWYYRRVFTGGEAARSAKCRLVFEGLDYGAVIYLNGRIVAEHANAFYPCEADVTGLLREGENVLIVQLESGLYTVSEKPMRGYYTATHSIDDALHKRVWLRKPQSSAEWDWSPRLLNVGIFGHVRLEYTEDIFVSQTSVRVETAPDLASARAEVRVFVDGSDSCGEGLELELTLEGATCRFPQEPGASCLSGAITIDRPRLWWPAGQGAQEMYECGVRVLANGRELYRTAKRFGVRHVEVDQSPASDGKGTHFILRVNGRPIFAKGGNFVPADMITANITRERYGTLIERALQANFNMLRVWGGGLYESDVFYELCDAHGILVWQEFICACSVLPYHDEAFTADVKREFIWNVRRLSEHPSLVVWCGNNESEDGQYWSERILGGIPYTDYALYHRVLPEILLAEDREKYYQPTSPYSPTLDVLRSDDYSGDQHPWSVGFSNKNHFEYREMECRFPNEGGALGPTSIGTMRACLGPGREELYSFAGLLHDNMLEGGRKSSADESVRQWLGLEPRSMTLEDYVYAGGLVHGEALGEYIHNFHRRKFLSGAAIFWMYNDCWPCTRSWTIVDYYLRVTPGYYAVRRAFAPVTLTVAQEADGSVGVYGVNDTSLDFRGTLRYGVFTCDGRYLADESVPVTLPANRSHRLAAMDGAAAQAQGIPFAVLCDESGAAVARHRLLRDAYHRLGLCPEQVEVRVEKGETVFSSPVFTMGVCLDLTGEQVLPDNLFDLYPGMELRLALDGPARVRYTLNRLLSE